MTLPSSVWLCLHGGEFQWIWKKFTLNLMYNTEWNESDTVKIVIWIMKKFKDLPENCLMSIFLHEDWK